MERRRTETVCSGDVGAAMTPGCRLRIRGERGTSLAEVLTSVLFVGILSAMSYSFARAALMSVRVQDVKAEAQEALVVATDMLVRELRLAGFSAAAQPLQGLVAAAPHGVEVVADLDGDGSVDGAHERIAYAHDAARDLLTRATGAGGAQPFLADVVAAGTRFEFYDEIGAALAPDGNGLSAEEMERVRVIEVHLRLQLANPEPRSRVPLAATLSATALLRNGQ
jgi:hypothetical protein